MWPLKNKLPESQIEQVENHLRTFLPARFRVSYDPSFPGSNENFFKWFQVVFEVGPAENSVAREHIHKLFERMLAILSDFNLVCESDHVSLRVRKHFPESETYNPDHPFMFIEADWNGSAIAKMKKQANFTSWTTTCLSYRNCFDRNDPLNTYEKNSPSKKVGA
jgi:hypothetical protein